MELLYSLHHRGSAVVVITHDPQVAARCSRQVSMRDGRVIADQKLPDRR
jgi:putative ABC transport system ATP-binding protein